MRLSGIKKLLFILIIFSSDLFAKDSGLISKENFYVGVDATKNDKTVGKIDNSVAADKVEEDRYYGYKLGNKGFFVAPEVSVSKTSSANSAQKSSNISNPFVDYNLKANVGYDFSKHISGFVTYDVAKFSYNSSQGGINAASSFNSTSPVVGVGSQINFSNDFGVKFSYSQQQFQNSSNGSGKINSDVINVGTVYSF